MTKMISNRWLLFAAGLLISGVSVAGARQAYQAPNEPTAAAPKLSPEDAIARATQMQSQMTEQVERVAKLLRQAESKRDMVMMNFVSDKLMQMKGYLAVGNQSVQAVQVAIQKHDDAAVAHALERQSIVFQKVIVLGTQAEGAAGEDGSYTGQTEVTVDVDPNIPNDDPTEPPAAVIPTPGRVPQATPFA